jgi:hypothetical protein
MKNFKKRGARRIITLFARKKKGRKTTGDGHGERADRKGQDLFNEKDLEVGAKVWAKSGKREVSTWQGRTGKQKARQKEPMDECKHGV